MQQLFCRSNVAVHSPDADFAGLNSLRLSIDELYHQCAGFVHIQRLAVTDLVAPQKGDILTNGNFSNLSNFLLILRLYFPACSNIFFNYL